VDFGCSTTKGLNSEILWGGGGRGIVLFAFLSLFIFTSMRLTLFLLKFNILYWLENKLKTNKNPDEKQNLLTKLKSCQTKRLTFCLEFVNSYNKRNMDGKDISKSRPRIENSLKIEVLDPGFCFLVNSVSVYSEACSSLWSFGHYMYTLEQRKPKFHPVAFFS
jgi:hypothetical protein